MDKSALQSAHYASVVWKYLHSPAWFILMLVPVLIAVLLIHRRAVMLRHPLGAFWVGVLACCAAHLVFVAELTLFSAAWPAVLDLNGGGHVVQTVTISAYVSTWLVALVTRTIKFDVFAVLCILVWPLPLFGELLAAGMILSG